MTVNDFVDESGYENLLKFDGLDEAIIGIISMAGGDNKLLYDYEKMLEIKMADGTSYEDAAEDLAYNTLCAYVGETTPAVLMVKPEEPITNE